MSPSAIHPAGEQRVLDRRWMGTALQGLVLLLAGFCIYAPILHGAWIWDDKVLITGHPVMADPGGWLKLWFAPPGPEYLPLSSTLEWLLWNGFGDNTLPFHLVGLLLHLSSAFLLWRLFVRLGLKLAWFGALLFVVHPLCVESVAFISELKNTLSLPLLLFSLLCWLRYDERGRPEDFGGALLSFLAAMLAKTSVVMLPLVLLLYTWWRHGRVTRAQLSKLLPFFAVSLILGIVTVCFQLEWAIGGGTAPVEIAPFAGRVAGAGWAIFFYVGKFLWPAGMHPIYLRWTFADWALAGFLPWIFVLAVAGCILKWRTTWGRPLALGLGFFLLNIAPALGFLPMAFQRFSAVADQFVYLPLIGLIGLAIGGIEFVVKVLPPNPPRQSVAAALAALVLIFAWQSRIYAKTFRSELALWSYARQDDPANPIAHYNLAFALVHAGRIRESIPEFEASLQSDAGDYSAENDLGTDYDLLGEPDLAIAHYTRSLLLKPTPETYSSLGMVYFKRGQFTEAARQFAAAVQLNHHFPEAEVNLGNTDILNGQLPQALAAYQTAIRLKPDYAAAYFDMGSVLAAQGHTTEALQAYETAVRLNPKDDTARQELARLRQMTSVPVNPPKPSP